MDMRRQRRMIGEMSPHAVSIFDYWRWRAVFFFNHSEGSQIANSDCITFCFQRYPTLKSAEKTRSTWKMEVDVLTLVSRRKQKIHAPMQISPVASARKVTSEREISVCRTASVDAWCKVAIIQWVNTRSTDCQENQAILLSFSTKTLMFWLHRISDYSKEPPFSPRTAK